MRLDIWTVMIVNVSALANVSDFVRFDVLSPPYLFCQDASHNMRIVHGMSVRSGVSSHDCACPSRVSVTAHIDPFDWQRVTTADAVPAT